MRRPVAIVAGAAAVVFAVLAARFAGADTAGRADVRIDTVIDSLVAAHGWLLRRAMTIGSSPSVVLLAIATAAACLLLGRRRLALLAILGPGITGLATTLLKPAIGRTIGDGFAFPSGHTGGATAIGLVAALLVVSMARTGRTAGMAVLGAGALLFGGTVGVAMVAANHHYPTDTIGGFCTAVVVVLGTALALDHLPRRTHD